MYDSILPVVVIGYGQMGKLYLDLLIEAGVAQCDIFVVDTEAARLHECSQKYRQVIVGTLRDALTLGPRTALVLSNSPSHLDVLTELAAAPTIEHVFCEKPAVLASQMANLEKMRDRFKTFVTGFVINFSLAVQELLAFMDRHDLRLVQGSGRWQKDRTGDTRPTAGDVEDELIHPAELLLMLARYRRRPERLTVRANVDFISFDDPKTQQAAHERDTSYPLLPPSTASATVVASFFRQPPVHLFVQSSFVGFEQDRRVEVLLASATAEGGLPLYKAKLEFDTPTGDVLSFASMGEKATGARAFPAKGKLGTMLMAFLNRAAGSMADLRLTTFEGSLSSVWLTKRILEDAGVPHLVS